MPVLAPTLKLLPSKHLFVTCYVSSIIANELDRICRYFELNFLVLLFCRLDPKAVERFLKYKVVAIL